MRSSAAGRALCTAVLVLLVSGCGAGIPADPEGTLDRAAGGALRVGVTDNDGWVDVGDGGDPTGTEPDLIEEFAASIGATVMWVPGSEQELVEDLTHGDLDVIIGGLADDTPWSMEAGMTRPYTESTDERGRTVKHVMLTRMGENALLLELDTFLLGKGGRP